MKELDTNIPLKQVGGDMGDKGYNGDIPNLKKGEYRYYIQDNKNLIPTTKKKISREAFTSLLQSYFPHYILSPSSRNSNSIDDSYWIGSIGEEVEYGGLLYYEPIIINKGYICFIEATALVNGTTYYIHDGYIYEYEELYQDEGLLCN